jgi:hypothetical protein
VQIMPLFFIAGGFSSLHHWRSMRAKGATASEYVRARIVRLVRPAIAVVVVVASGLVMLRLAGLPEDLVATAGFRIGQPLWFLGVYLVTSALVPVMVRAHERARLLTPIALLAAVVAVDVVRLSTGIDAIGLLNLVLVWLLVQQLGFHLADGALDRLRPSALLEHRGRGARRSRGADGGGPVSRRHVREPQPAERDPRGARRRAARPVPARPPAHPGLGRPGGCLGLHLCGRRARHDGLPLAHARARRARGPLARSRTPRPARRCPTR